MLTEKDYCDYDTCVALREVGCRIETEWYIHQPSYERGNCYLCFGIPRETSVLDECDYIPRLSLYEAQKWLREEKNIEANASFDKMEDGWIAFIQRLDYPDLYGTDVFSTVYNTYESALLVSIKEAVKILKEK